MPKMSQPGEILRLQTSFTDKLYRQHCLDMPVCWMMRFVCQAASMFCISKAIDHAQTSVVLPYQAPRAWRLSFGLGPSQMFMISYHDPCGFQRQSLMYSYVCRDSEGNVRLYSSVQSDARQIVLGRLDSDSKDVTEEPSEEQPLQLEAVHDSQATSRNFS